MTSQTDTRFSPRCGVVIRQFLLVVLTIGVEACVTLELILMITNEQTLGVPIKYSSLPGTISAALGIVLIPSLGWLIDKKAKSTSVKAMILFSTTSLQIVGSALVFLANTILLLWYDDDGISGNATAWEYLQTSRSRSISNTISNASLFTPYPTISAYSVGGNSSSSLASDVYDITTSVFLFHNSTKQNPVNIVEPVREGKFRYYSVIAMIGYLFLDCGYDSSSCFLKTFALASTAPSDHSSIIVKSVFVSAFGGCLISVLGSLSLGDSLTAGTNHDSNAAQCALISAVCFVLVVFGLITTLTTGFCCPPSGYMRLEEDIPKDEKSELIETDELSRNMTSSESAWRSSHGNSKNVLEKTLSGASPITDTASSFFSHDEVVENHVIDHADLSPRKGVLRFIIKHKKEILINLSTFFFMGAVYSFSVHVVNFVGSGIFQGDPLAKVNSVEYKKYLDGISAGSQGILIYYITFTLSNMFHEFSLEKLGWKLETLIISAMLVVVNLVCALTATLWSFYVTAVWAGIYRAVVMSVPYILANKIVQEEGKGKDSGVAMATVAAMLPLAFTVASGMMGPLIDATGNPATPIYYTAVNSFLGFVTICFLKSN